MCVQTVCNICGRNKDFERCPSKDCKNINRRTIVCSICEHAQSKTPSDIKKDMDRMKTFMTDL